MFVNVDGKLLMLVSRFFVSCTIILAFGIASDTEFLLLK